MAGEIEGRCISRSYECYNALMELQDKKSYLPHIIPAGVVFVVLGAVFVYLFLRISNLSQYVGTLTTELASTTSALAKNTNQLSDSLTDLRSQTSGLSNTLSNAEQNINDVKSKVGGVAQTVGTLEKLSRIDPELLKKYSKVYFMNENYVPAHLTDIRPEYRFNETRNEQFMTEAWPFLKLMLDAANANGKPLYVKSAYRSFAEQQSLKSQYSVVYGAGTANSFSADQGYSEHQLGTTLDFIATRAVGSRLEGFDSTNSYKWLVENAHRFGFVLSYPKGNTYYVYEPWHWRFVGVKLAASLQDNKLNFYDVDQRQIDAYLISVFD